VDENTASVESLQEDLKRDPTKQSTKVDLLLAQKRVSNMKAESDVEMVVRNRSLQLFKTKCPSVKEAKAYQHVTRYSYLSSLNSAKYYNYRRAPTRSAVVPMGQSKEKA